MAIVSIVVPVYKAEKFIERTICSVQEQTFVDWELILVVDGSPDNSAKICRERTIGDKRIKVIEQENQGAHAARLTGLYHCTAPFVTFLDSDDWLPFHSLDIMCSEINKGYDIVKGMVAINMVPKRKSRKEYHTISFNRQQFLEQLYLGEIAPYMCGSIYRRELLNDYIFQLCIDNRLSIGEDWITNLYVGKKIETVCIVNEYTYVYTENSNGVMNTSVMSQTYSERMNRIVDAIIDYNTPEWEYLKSLKAAICMSDLFVWERGYSHQAYTKIWAFIEKNGKDELRRRCDPRYLYFINFEPLFYVYSRLYAFAKKILKDKSIKKRKIIE